MISRIITRRDKMSIGIISFTVIIVLISPGIMYNSTNNFNAPTIHFVYGQPSQISISYNNNNTNSLNVQNIPAKKVHVGDIDIAYKTFGKGRPLLFIPGFSMTMDGWDPIVLDKLSSNHTIIVFDNRGIGYTTAGVKTPSIQQFANDTAALIDALEIKKPVDIFGLSMGGLIAQELALLHPDKVDRLVIHASSCGGKESLPPQVSPQVLRSMISGNASADTFLSTLFPKEWIQQHTDYIQKNFVFPMGKVSKESLQHQFEATSKWGGACSRLATITKPTLVITGTEDITSPPANSILIADKIPGAWLVQIRGGGHGVMFQYPQQFTSILETFFSVT
ncbi:MAG TPA: alpha/beta hydrolase [Nitrososphaeraceae archaeon]|nr:alpha/beta hydrolase [Nitrososphaeraceae archaeon]